MNCICMGGINPGQESVKFTKRTEVIGWNRLEYIQLKDFSRKKK